MIQSKYINGIIAAAVALALIAALLLVGFSNSQAANSGLTQQYETKLFGGDIITIDIIADQSDWDSMIENATAEEYIMVDVVINGTKFQKVGIRPKGNSSLSQVARDSTNNRFSFRLKFDQYIKGQTCFGLNTFVVNNMLGDNSYMKEYLSYDIFNYIGVDAPLFDFTNISVNGKAWGFYLAIEAYDDSYLSRVYGDTTGNLYNVKSMDMGNNDNNQMPNGQVPNGVQVPNIPNGGQVPNTPNGGQMPNKANGGQVPNTSNSGQTANKSNDRQMPNSNGAETQTQTQNKNQIPNQQNTDTPNMQGKNTQTAENATNMDSQAPNGNRGNFMGGGIGGRGSSGGDLKYSDENASSYSAIFNNAIGKSTEEDQQRVITALEKLSTGTDLETYFDVDQILRYMAAHTVAVNLDSYSSSMAQNYYIYEKDGEITILPWDYNFSFGGFQSGSASAVVNFPIDTPVSGVTLAERPLFDKLLANEEYKEKYHKYLNEIMTGYFADGKWAEKVSQLDTLIASYVESDPTAFCTIEEYKKALPALTTLGELRAKSIMGQLEGIVPSTTTSQSENPQALISADSLTLSDLGGGMGGGDRGNMGGQNQDNNVKGQVKPAGGFGDMSNMPDMATMQKAMEIIQSANGKSLTEEQTTQLTKLGLTTDQITSLLNLGNQFGGRLPNQNGGAANENIQKPNGNANIQNNVVQTAKQDNQSNQNNIIIVCVLVILLLLANVFVSKYKRNY